MCASVDIYGICGSLGAALPLPYHDPCLYGGDVWLPALSRSGQALVCGHCWNGASFLDILLFCLYYLLFPDYFGVVYLLHQAEPVGKIFNKAVVFVPAAVLAACIAGETLAVDVATFFGSFRVGQAASQTTDLLD